MSHPYQAYHIGVPVPPTNPPIPPPQLGDLVYEIPVSPRHSPPQSRAASRTRRATGGDPYISYGGDYRDKQYHQEHLSVRGGGGTMGRSNSVGGFRGGRVGIGMSMEVGDSRPSRPRSIYDEYRRHGNVEEEFRGRPPTVYYGKYAESTYSSSSRGSRENSRGPPYHRRARSPSCHSCDGHEYPHSPQLPYPPSGYWPPALTGAPQPPPATAGAMTLFNPNVLTEANPQLEKQIQDLQNQLALSKLESERIQKAKEAQEETAKKKRELQELLEQALARKDAEEQAAKAAKEAEYKKIQEEARRLKEAEEAAIARKEAEYRETLRRLEEEQRAEKARQEAEQKKLQEEYRKLREREEAEKAAKEAEAKRLKELVQSEARKLVEAEKKKDEAKKKKEEEERKKKEEDQRVLKLDLTKPTYTKFSKVHLCKEALDEQHPNMVYTEQEDSFLVHRWVDHSEQQKLWNRTKEIRAYQHEYQRQFKEAADKAPIVQTAGGPVKIVKVGNHPPVTVPVVMVTKKANSEPEPVKFRQIFGMR